MLFAQLSGAHTVVLAGYFWQPPEPSHLPLVPQVETSWVAQVLCGSEAPAATAVHLPSVWGSAHDLQPALQAELQQTPSAQKPVAHSVPAAHGCPVCLGPQLPFTQAWPGSQSESLVQTLMQAPSRHNAGEQESRPGARQV